MRSDTAGGWAATLRLHVALQRRTLRARGVPQTITDATAALKVVCETCLEDDVRVPAERPRNVAPSEVQRHTHSARDGGADHSDAAQHGARAGVVLHAEVGGAKHLGGDGQALEAPAAQDTVQGRGQGEEGVEEG